MKKSKIIKYDEYQFISYTELDYKDRKIALDYRNQNREWMVNQDFIQLKDHENWIRSLNNDRSKMYYLVFKEETPFMSIYYHDIDFDKKEAYWGYFLGNQKYKSEVLTIEKIIIDFAFNKFKFNKLLCINNINNNVIEIHKFFGFQEDGVVTINGQDFLQMYLNRHR